jgi:hypothetical protein
MSEKHLAAHPELLARLIIVLGLALLGGCTAVYLRHPETGKTVKCGPYFGDPASDHSARLLKRGCIEDYERQGYERLMEDSKNSPEGSQSRGATEGESAKPRRGR